MKYSVKLNESNLVMSANDSETFFEEFAKLPEGDYTVNVMSDLRRSGKHRRKMPDSQVTAIVNMVLEIIAIVVSLGCIVPLWIVACALL